MKSAWFSTIILITVCSIAIFSCKKDDDKKTTTTAPLGAGKGDGGNITYRITPVHDNVNIDSCWVYVEYNSEFDQPQTNLYDDSVKCKVENGKPVATFSELRKGTYLFYAIGWDLVRSQTVEGSRVLYATEERTTNVVDLQLHAK